MVQIECYKCLKRAFFVDIEGNRRCVHCTPYKEKWNGYYTVRNSNKRPTKGSQFTTLSMDSESFIYSVVMDKYQGD